MLLYRSKEVSLLAVGLILLVSGIASHHFFGIRQDKAPTAIEPALFDFGKAGQGQTLSHTFRLRNKGKEPIAITKSDSSCSCTSGAKLEGTTIRPGEAVDLPVTLKTGAGDGSESGRVTREIRVKSARPVRIAGLRASDGAIRLAAVGPSEGSNLRVRATVLDDDHRAINAKITIDLVPGMRTAGAEVRTVTIPIHRLAC